MAIVVKTMTTTKTMTTFSLKKTSKWAPFGKGSFLQIS